MTNETLSWRAPRDLAERSARDEISEDDRYAPLQLSVIGGVLFEGRLVTCWQISFVPYDLRESSAASLVDGSTDGDDWAGLIRQHVAETRPDLAPRLHDDSEGATCVTWVETQADAEALLAVLWSILVEGSSRQ